RDQSPLADSNSLLTTMGYHLDGPRITHTHKRHTIIPSFLYVTFIGLKPHFSIQIGRHVHIN
ncbi:hypothetical protein B0H17DRAFT_226150, partial [Mycena rosella]